MPKNEDLHGNAPDKSKVALLIIDMICDFEFSGGDRLCANAAPISKNIASLKKKANKAGVPVIYVNDNFGEWHSERYRLVERAITSDAAREFVAKLAPRDGDYFIIKPQFSGFYATNLPVLLPKLGVDRLVITGIAADICVMFTAADAHMRDYSLWIPEDAVAAQTRERILESALELASTEGLTGLSIGRLADRNGMSKSGLFAHFGSKEELQIAVLVSQGMTNREVAARLGWSLTKFNRKLDNVCQKLKKAGVQGLHGDSEKQIAAKLEVSRHTVHDYAKRLYRYFDAASRGELLAKVNGLRLGFRPRLAVELLQDED